ncbi:hypothetical protein ACFSHQ_14635 [Gemmobacter lanyuensis]
MTATLAGSSMVSRAAWVGAGLALLNTLVSVSADAIAKDLIVSYAAPQLMALSGGWLYWRGWGRQRQGRGASSFGPDRRVWWRCVRSSARQARSASSSLSATLPLPRSLSLWR